MNVPVGSVYKEVHVHGVVLFFLEIQILFLSQGFEGNQVDHPLPFHHAFYVSYRGWDKSTIRNPKSA